LAWLKKQTAKKPLIIHGICSGVHRSRSFIWQNKRSDTRLSIKHLHATELFSQMDLYKP
jgi:hypothetical protein